MLMYGFKGFLNRVRHYFRFSKEEIEAVIISVLVMAFIISFGDWGYGDKVNFGVGLTNLSKAVIIMILVLGFQIIVMKMQAISWGYRAEFKLWWYGIIGGLGLAFLSASFSNSFGQAAVLWFLAPGGIFFHHLAVHRLGWFRYGIGNWQMGLVCMVGSLSSILLAIIFKIFLSFFPESLFFEKALTVSLWYALFTILPIPPLNGSRLFFASRITFFFIFGVIVGFNILLRTNINILLVILISFILGALAWAFNLWRWEPTWR